MQKTRHIPQRRCFVCGDSGDKTALLRIVRDSAGYARTDATGKQAGRGAYICSKVTCREMVLKKGRLESVLKTTLSDDNYALLIASLKRAGDSREAAQ